MYIVDNRACLLAGLHGVRLEMPQAGDEHRNYDGGLADSNVPARLQLDSNHLHGSSQFVCTVQTQQQLLALQGRLMRKSPGLVMESISLPIAPVRELMMY